MISRETVDGRNATVAYLDDKWNPCDPEDADFAKIIFDDGQIVVARHTQSERSYSGPMEYRNMDGESEWC